MGYLPESELDTITVKLDPKVEARLRVYAKKKGMTKTVSGHVIGDASAILTFLGCEKAEEVEKQYKDEVQKAEALASSSHYDVVLRAIDAGRISEEDKKKLKALL